MTELAAELGLTGMGIRRHLESLELDGLVERSACPTHGVGRPPNGWRLSAAGLELLPRRYDTFVLQLLEDMCEQVGEEGVEIVLQRRSEKQAIQYRDELAGADTLEDRVAGLAGARDRAGYLAETSQDGEIHVLIENNCAVHRVAERFPAVCAMELSVFRMVLGPDVEVTRVSHAMSGDAACAYCIRPRPADPAD